MEKGTDLEVKGTNKRVNGTNKGTKGTNIPKTGTNRLLLPTCVTWDGNIPIFYGVIYEFEI